MAFITSPTHGKYAALYRYRANGFKGNGLNDLTWGTGYSGGGTTGDFEVEIDSEGTPDTFKWRKNGGAYTTGVAITGAAQTLSDSQTITFAATTGHTTGERWVVGNLDTELTTESGATAQITEATHRLTIPNKLTWTDDGGKTVEYTEWAEGKATFTANVGNVTVSGNNAYIIPSGLEKIGYLQGWDLTINNDMVDVSRCGQEWKEFLPGQGGASGSANILYLSSDTMYWDIYENIQSTEDLYLLELETYDVDQDQTGDMFKFWASFNSWGLASSVSDAVRENIAFTVFGHPSLIAAT